MLTPEHLAEAEQAIERASIEVGAVCAEGAHRRWRMSIPANPSRDSDLIISSALNYATTLAAEVKRLQSEVEETRAQLITVGNIANSEIAERERAEAEVKRLKAERGGVDPARVDRALRAVIADLDYDLHKAIERDEETGEDTYHETVDAFIKAYEAAGS